ncbi:MAG: alpha/beta fold hydrolase [Bellilinea sp.]
MPKIGVNGVELYYELLGPADGSPADTSPADTSPVEGEVIVLSNGVLMSTASWGLQKAALSRHHRLLLYDCRGMWQSQRPAGPYTMEQHADDLAALLTALNVPSAHIGGISYGGEISLAFALKYPHMTRSLIVSSSVSHSEPVLKGLIDAWIAAARARDPRLLFEVTYPLNFSSAYIHANQASLEVAGARYAQLDMDAVLELFDCFQRLNITAELHRIIAPTLVLVGELDILKPRMYSEIIAREIPGAQLVVVPGSGHALCLEKPTIFNTLVLGFVEQVDGR